MNYRWWRLGCVYVEWVASSERYATWYFQQKNMKTMSKGKQKIKEKLSRGINSVWPALCADESGESAWNLRPSTRNKLLKQILQFPIMFQLGDARMNGKWREEKRVEINLNVESLGMSERQIWFGGCAAEDEESFCERLNMMLMKWRLFAYYVPPSIHFEILLWPWGRKWEILINNEDKEILRNLLDFWFSRNGEMRGQIVCRDCVEKCEEMERGTEDFLARPTLKLFFPWWLYHQDGKRLAKIFIMPVVSTSSRQRRDRTGWKSEGQLEWRELPTRSNILMLCPLTVNGNEN